MKAELILKNYEIAKERYAALGVDTDKAIETLEKTPISLHCWQADDVVGFERGEAASGGIQSTGNYPGKARNIDELRQDIEKVNSLLAGTFRLNLHEIYGEFGGKQIDRNEVSVDQFTGWMQWAKEQNMKLDFNSTSFSHPKSGSLSLSNPDPAIREFWIEHTKRCRRIADAMGKFQNDPCIMNIWVHDGSKDITVEKGRYREILKNSLDEILYAFCASGTVFLDCLTELVAAQFHVVEIRDGFTEAVGDVGELRLELSEGLSCVVGAFRVDSLLGDGTRNEDGDAPVLLVFVLYIGLAVARLDEGEHLAVDIVSALLFELLADVGSYFLDIVL